jgi:hypothetical protein
MHGLLESGKLEKLEKKIVLDVTGIVLTPP